jgi:hypothetical membrane protein
LAAGGGMSTKSYNISSVSKSSVSNPALRGQPITGLVRTEPNDRTESTSKIKKIYGMAGMLGPTIGLLSLYAATKDCTNFSWQTQAISDFFSTKADSIMTMGLVASGALTAISANGLYEKYSNSGILRTGAILLGIGGMSLAAVGIAHNNLSFMHVPAATGYFTATPASLITLGAGFLKDKYKKIVGGSTLAVGIVSLAILAENFYPGLAIKETVSSALFGSWVFGAGTSMLFSRENSNNRSSTN